MASAAKDRLNKKLKQSTFEELLFFIRKRCEEHQECPIARSVLELYDRKDRLSLEVFGY